MKFVAKVGKCLVEMPFGIGIHQELVKVICDPASILNLGNHVTHSLPGRLAALPCLHVNQMVLPREAKSSFSGVPSRIHIIKSAALTFSSMERCGGTL